MSLPSQSKLEWFDLLLSLDNAGQKRALEEIRAQDLALAGALEDLLAADAVLHQQQKHLALPEQLSGLSAAVGIAKNIAGFELLELLGQGGMGEVWLAARDIAGMRQKVALKLMRTSAQSDEFRQRFVREQRALLRLEHPNIARLIDAGVTPEGMPWIAMEYIEGDSLIRYCDHRSLTVRARLTLFRQVLAAVQFAHDHFLVHRDLKPDNIYVSARGEVKLLDFGIVKSLTDDAKQETRPYFSAYAPAPEQLLGQRIFVTTDVYGLGGVLYELLSGSLLIDVDAPSFNWLTHAEEFAPRAPSLRVRAEKAVLRGGLSAQALSALLRGELDRIVLHALRSAAAERYASARQFDQDIEAYLEHRPVRAAGQSRLYLLKKFLQRHWLLASVSAMSLMALVSLSLMLFLRGEQLQSQRNQAMAQRQVAELARAQAERATVAAEAANEFLVGVFKRANPLAEAGADRRLKSLVEASFAEHLEQSKNAPLSATFLIALAQSLAALGENDKAQHLLESITTPLSRAEQFSIYILRAEIAKSQANTVKLAAEFALAKPLAQSASERRRLMELEVAVASLQRNHSRVVELLGTQFQSVRLVQMQVDSLMALGNTRAARALVDAALSLPALPKTQRPSMYEALVTLADREDHHDQALAWSEKALQEAKQVFGASHPELLRFENMRASQLQKTGQFVQAIAAIEDLQQRVQQRFGASDRRLRFLSFNLAISQASLGQLTEVSTERLESALAGINGAPSDVQMYGMSALLRDAYLRDKKSTHQALRLRFQAMVAGSTPSKELSFWLGLDLGAAALTKDQQDFVDHRAKYDPVLVRLFSSRLPK